jgi:hypothetical protein
VPKWLHRDDYSEKGLKSLFSLLLINPNLSAHYPKKNSVFAMILKATL